MILVFCYSLLMLTWPSALRMTLLIIPSLFEGNFDLVYLDLNRLLYYRFGAPFINQIRIIRKQIPFKQDIHE